MRAGDSELHLTGSSRACSTSWRAAAGQVVTRDEILDALWGVDYVSESNVVDRHVRNLRAKLQNDWRKPRFIATVTAADTVDRPTEQQGAGWADEADDSSDRTPRPRNDLVTRRSVWVVGTHASGAGYI